MGLPDTLVSARDPRFTSEFGAALHAALGTSLIFGSPHHHNTNSRTERVNGVIADVLRSFVDGRQDDWPSLIPLVEFAINDTAFPPGSATGTRPSTRTGANTPGVHFRCLVLPRMTLAWAATPSLVKWRSCPTRFAA